MTLEEDFGSQSRAAHLRTFADLEAEKQYVSCPQCDGDGMLYAYWESDGSYGENVSCPCCGGTREAEDGKAINWLTEEQARKGWDDEDGL